MLSCFSHRTGNLLFRTHPRCVLCALSSVSFRPGLQWHTDLANVVVPFARMRVSISSLRSVGRLKELLCSRDFVASSQKRRWRRKYMRSELSYQRSRRVRWALEPIRTDRLSLGFCIIATLSRVAPSFLAASSKPLLRSLQLKKTHLSTEII